MDAGLFDVLHDTANVQLVTVVDGVDVDLDRVVEKTVDEKRMPGADDSLPGHAREVIAERRGIVDDLHAAAAEHVAGAHEHRVTDFFGHHDGSGEVDRRSVAGGEQAGVAQNLREQSAFLGEVDRVGGGTENGNAGRFQAAGEAQRGLAAELHDHADEFAALAFGIDDLEHVFEGERFKVQPVAGVVVGGDRLRVAVDHDGLVAGLRQCEGGVHAGVVEFDALPDAVRSGAENDDLTAVTGDNLGLVVVAGVVVRREGGKLPRTGVDSLEHGAHAENVAHGAHIRFAKATQLANLGVREAVVLGEDHDVAVEPVGRGHLVGDLVDEHDLVDEPRIDLGGSVHLLDRRTAAEGLLHGDDAAVGGNLGDGEQFVDRAGLLAPVKARPALLERPQGFLQGGGVAAADGHGFTDRLHGGGQALVGGRKLLKREAGHLDHDVVEGGFEACRGDTGDVVGNLVEAVAEAQFCSDLGDRKAGRLAGEG